MIRTSEPLIAPAEKLRAEGRSRIAFFVGAMREQPEVMAALLRGFVTCDNVSRAAESIASDDTESYENRAILAAKAVFEHGDDKLIRLDAETRTAVAEARAMNAGRGLPLDPRIAAAAAVACEFAGFSQYQELAGVEPGSFRDTEILADIVPLRPAAQTA